MTPKKPTDHTAQLTELWTAHYEKLERATAAWAGRHRHDPDVQDAIQTTYERTLRFLSRGGTFPDSPSGWLITVARREFLRIIGGTGRTSELYDGERSRAMIDPGPEPEGVVLDQAQRTLDGALEKALARLTPRERAVLSDFHAGYSYAEIGERRGLTRTAVNRAIYEGRVKLRRDGALEQAYRQWSD